MIRSTQPAYKIGTLKRWSILIALLLTGNVYAQNNSKDQSNRPPNIVFIMADDLGFGELGSYGNRFNETPHLDKFAQQSKRFTQAYTAAAVCSPTRVSIMTGKYPARVGITDFLPESEKTKRYLDPNEYVTLNEALQQLGYHTGIVGKWHLDTQFKDPKGSPKNHGFDEVIGSETQYIADGDYFYPYTMVGSFPEGTKDEYLTDRQNQEACAFIKRNQQNPFFLYLSYYSVHTRLEAPEKTVAKYKAKFDAKYGAGKSELFENSKQKEGNHPDNPYLAAMLEHIDNGVGMIMQTLKEMGLSDNTIVIFTSDNGGANLVANNGHLKANKSWLYEGGIRVPFLVHWPNKIQPGVDNTATCSIDYFPTFVAAAGGQIKQPQVDGVNLMPLLTEGKALDRTTLYWHYPCETAKWTERMSTSVRHGDYKLIKFYLDDRYELYNLKEDPSEKINLASKEPQKRDELVQLMESWKKEVQAEEPDADAIQKARKQPALQAQKRQEELTKSLQLSSSQATAMHAILLHYFRKHEDIRKFYMPSDQRKEARQKNNKERDKKIVQILTQTQIEKFKKLNP